MMCRTTTSKHIVLTMSIKNTVKIHQTETKDVRMQEKKKTWLLVYRRGLSGWLPPTSGFFPQAKTLVFCHHVATAILATTTTKKKKKKKKIPTQGVGYKLSIFVFAPSPKYCTCYNSHFLS